MRMVRRGALAVAGLALLAGLMPGAKAATRSDADWSEAYFTSADGVTKLHADILRPKGLAANVKTPVILTVSPYTGHTGDTPTALNLTASGHSNRFYDFLDLSNILKKGYTYVMVDLPGTGGSQSCNDWGGAREQAGVKSAVEWAASQPWSTGKVGMIGKSYDGWTGLMGIAQKAQGLAAVISMEPVYSGYRYIYTNGVRISSTQATIAAFQAGDARPGSINDTPEYHVGAAPQPWCYGVNVAGSQQDAETDLYWAERNLLPALKGATTPLLLTQGFLETNTKQDGAFDVYASMAGPKRAWFGQFNHIRGWEKGATGRLLSGRDGFTEEVMRFLDTYVKGIPADETGLDKDPAVYVQDSDGNYRAEAAWPPADAVARKSALTTGTYTDSGSGSATGGTGPTGLWTFSQPLERDMHLAGEPVIEVTADGVPRSNLVVDLYDVDGGSATYISRSATLLRGTGPQNVSFKLYGQDWVLPAGHRLGVVITSANTDWWTHVATRQTVTVSKASISLPLLPAPRTEFVNGGSTPDLEAAKNRRITVSAATIAANTKPFDLG